MSVSDRELAQWIRRELAQAEGYASGELAEMRKKALDRYYGRPLGNEIDGRSDAQSNDIADMVEALIAQLLPGFAGDSPVEFEPESEDDVERVQLESDLVNDVLLETNQGYTLFQEALRDALLLRNGWIKVWLDERKDVQTAAFKGVPEEAVAQVLAQPAPPGVTRELVKVSDADGGLVDFSLRETTVRQRLRVTSVDPVMMRWSKSYDSVFLDDIPFLAERWYPTRSELISRGYSRAAVERLPAASMQDNAQEQARDQESGGQRIAPDPSTENVGCYWIHYRYDSDGDGVAELHRILYGEGAGEGAILENEPVEFVPYATGTAFLQAHRLNGLGLWDKMRTTESNKTQILRQWIDNLAVANNQRLAVNARTVIIEDAVNSRPGGIIRVNGDIPGNLLPIPTMDVGASAMLALQYQDKIRSERGGASLDLQTAQMQIAGDTAHGVERQMASRELLAAMMARTLAETLIRQTYLLVHRGLRAWITQPMRARLSGKFLEVRPDGWPPRDRVNVKTGLSPAERGQRRQALEMVIAQQEKLSAAGYEGVLVTAQQYHSAIMDWTRAAAIDNGARYFADPSSDASKQAAEQKQKQAQTQQQIQLQIASTAAAAQQQAAQIEQAMAKYKTDAELAFKYWDAVLNAELKEAEAAIDMDAEGDALESIGVARSGQAQERAA